MRPGAKHRVALSARPDMQSGYGASVLAREIGRRVKEVRLLSGLSRRDLGIRLGVCGQQVHKYEIGQDCVPLHRLLALASICGVPAQSFWEHDDPAAAGHASAGATDTGTPELVRAYRRIKDAGVRERLLQLIRQMAGGDDASPEL